MRAAPKIRQLIFAALFFGAEAAAVGARIPEYPAEGAESIVSIENIDKIHSSGMIYLRTNFGDQKAQRIAGIVRELDDSFRIVAACGGSFSKPGSVDVSLALVKADLSQVVYVALLGNELRLLRVLVQPAAATGHNTLPKIPSVRCDSWTSIERENSRIRHSGSEEKSPIKRLSQMDAVCAAPMNSDMEYVCFNFDARTSKFIGIGGWRTE